MTSPKPNDDFELFPEERPRRKRFVDEISGMRIELPFITLQFGAGASGASAVQDNDPYNVARMRVMARLGFYRHLATFAAVLGAFLFIDLITGGGVSTPVLWVAGIWGAILVWQAFNVFVFPSIWSRETEERMIDQELRKNRER